MSIALVLIGALVVGIILAELVAWAFRRAFSSAKANPNPGPSTAEAKIHTKAQAERAQLPEPDPAAVHAMSDKEVEDAANDRRVVPLRRK